MKTLYGKKWYKPREIAELGLIKNSIDSEKVLSNYWSILRLIKSEKLKAKNYCTTGKQMWLVSEDAIKEYIDRFVSKA